MLSFIIATLMAASVASAARSNCDANSLAVYNVTFTGLWSKDVFPKQYPLFRPPAQWTKVLGRSHDDGYNIFALNETASEGLKEFVQTGVTREFDRETQGQTGILDIFTTAAVRHGVGQAQARFFVDGVRSKVSMIARIVPSPDWFVGVDSLEMCQGGQWQERLTLDLDPMDAGTDQGYTFTSPNWAENPQKPISMITAHMPSHPANSFYYPDIDKLPTVAKLEFVKVRTYSWKDGVRPEIQAAAPSEAEKPSQDSTQEVQNEEAEIEESNTTPEQNGKEETTTVTVPSTNAPRGLVRSNERARQRGGRRKERKGRRGRKNRQRRPQPSKEVINAMNAADRMVDCQVSEWGPWGPCSKTCGFGTRTRLRAITQKPENFGHPCPLLTEDQLCGSMRNCGWTHFRGLNQRFGSRGNGTSRRRIFRFGQ